MGTWSTRIFDDDGAADIRAEYRSLLGYKMDPEQAWQLIYNYFYPDFKDSDDEDVFWLSVALYQWQNGILIEEVKQRALDCIDDESYLEVWKESDPAVYKKRKAVLTQLKDKLINEVNAPRKVAKCPPYYREKTKFSIGDVFSYTHENGNISYIEVARIRKKPVTKLAPELDYRSISDFALLDSWSKKRHSLEELSELPYRKFYIGGLQAPYIVDACDTISIDNEDIIREKMDYLGRISREWEKEPTFFRKGGMEPFPQKYTQYIESTFSLPCGITNEMLNATFTEFLNDSTLETLELRIKSRSPQLTQSISIALKLILVRLISFLNHSIRSHHIYNPENAEKDDIESLWWEFPWSSEENVKRLAEKIIPVDANVIETDYGDKIFRAVNKYYNSLKSASKDDMTNS